MDEETLKIIFGVVGAAIYLLIQVVPKLLGDKMQQRFVAPRTAPKVPQPPVNAPPATAFGAPKSTDKKARRKVLDRISSLQQRSIELASSVTHDRPNQRFEDTLTRFVPQQLSEIRGAVRSRGVFQGVGYAVDSVEMIVDEIEILIEQRRDKVLLPQLGDADTFADACYGPIITFAQTEGLPLRSAYPATQIGELDVAIWTGFIRTSIAPIFLPEDFFSTTVKWPAIAHEIGHDFLACVDGLESQLRRELGLPSAEVGCAPLNLWGQKLDPSEFLRVFGAWFEEIFCDVFGTLMCGPAYVASMTEVFASDGDHREVLLVKPDASGYRYDIHPPCHLRVLTGCMILERAGFHADAKELRDKWARRHNETTLDRLLFPVGRAIVAIPLEIFEPILGMIVDRLYTGPFHALNGFGLQSISGLDYGPHEYAQSIRARDTLLAGEVPTVRDVRAIIAGVVLAGLRRPERVAQIIHHARAAIPAKGTGEVRPDAYTQGEAEVQALPAGAFADQQAILEALVLREVLAGPRAAQRRHRRTGL